MRPSDQAGLQIRVSMCPMRPSDQTGLQKGAWSVQVTIQVFKGFDKRCLRVNKSSGLCFCECPRVGKWPGAWKPSKGMFSRPKGRKNSEELEG
jgi:hypothetical protein